jgi:DNA polymerase-4
MVCSTVQITIRDPEMTTITRSFTMAAPTESIEDVYRTACGLMDEHWTPGNPVRLLGITLQGLAPKRMTPVQMDLFSYEEAPKREKLTTVMDQLRDKFGEGAVLTAGMLGDDPSSLIRNKKVRGTSLQTDFLREDSSDIENGY